MSGLLSFVPALVGRIAEGLGALGRHALRSVAQQGLMSVSMAAALPRVIVVGEGGAGKSTLLKQMLARAAKAGKVPVWVPLASLPIDGPLTIASLLDHLCGQARSALGLPEVNAAYFESLVREGRLAIGFDALDECGSLARRQKVRGLIVEVSREWHGCQVFVTSRPEALRETPFLLMSLDTGQSEESTPERFLALEPLPFTRDDVAPFLRATFADGDALAKQLSARTGIEALLESPLTLTLVGLVARSSTGGLPSTRTPLFAQCLKTVCDTWEDAKGASHNADGLDPAQRLDVLQRLGWLAQGLEGNVVSALAARKMLAATPAFSAPGRAQAIVNGLASRNLLLRADTAGAGGLEVRSVRFAHPQFREYLAGAHFADQFALDAVTAALSMAPRWFDSGWLDVLRFAVATLENDPALRDDLLRTALDAADPYADLLHRPQFLVARLLARLTSADRNVVATVAACMEQLTTSEPALRDEAARSLLALAPHAPATPAIRRFALGQGGALAFAQDHAESFQWRLRAVEALAVAGHAGEARKIALELPTHGVSAVLDVCTVRARLGDREGALAVWKECFDGESPGFRPLIGASMDQAGETGEFDAWLQTCLASGLATVEDARLAQQRGVGGDLAPTWRRLFSDAAAALATMDASSMFAPSVTASAVYAALDPTLPDLGKLPEHRALVTAAMHHPAFTWFVGDKMRALYPDLMKETIERLTRYVLDEVDAHHDHSRVRSAVLALSNDRDDAAAGLAELRPTLTLPAGVDDRHPDGLERRRDIAWRLARELDAAQSMVLLDEMHRGGGAETDARRLIEVWTVSGVAAVARDWFHELARDGAGPQARRFLQALAAQQQNADLADTAQQALDGGTVEDDYEKEHPPPWTLADCEAVFEFALQRGHFVDEHDGEEAATVDSLLGLLSSIIADADHATAQPHADAWVEKTLNDGPPDPDVKVDRLAQQLAGLSRLGLTNRQWLESAAALARCAGPAARTDLVGWLSVNA